MWVVCIQQCDAIEKGRKTALFAGQRYDLPPAVAEELAAGGRVRLYREAAMAFVPDVATERVRVTGRPQNRGKNSHGSGVRSP